jgi:hypothetical protein
LKYRVYGRAYVNGNVMEGYPEITKDNWNGGVQVEEMKNTGEYTDNIKWNTPLPMPSITVLSATEARKYVLANAGATLPRRDAVDTRIVKQVTTGKIDADPNVKLPETQFKHRRMAIDSYKIGIITDPSQAGGYPDYKGTSYKDSDNDGMPDAYEVANKLNPNDANDAAKITRNGYSNIEVYLNSVVSIANVKPAVIKK